VSSYRLRKALRANRLYVTELDKGKLHSLRVTLVPRICTGIVGDGCDFECIKGRKDGGDARFSRAT